MRVQIAQIDHSMYPARPIPDDMMSITTNQLEDEQSPDQLTEEMTLESQQAEEEENRPEDFSPRLWQLFNRIQRRGTEPLFPADWQVPNSPPSRLSVFSHCPCLLTVVFSLVGFFEYST
jgi:hypothetical protein